MTDSVTPRIDRGKSPSAAVVGRPWISSYLRRGLAFGMMVWSVLTAPALHGQGLAATFNTAADVPVTATSYTATGEATFTLGFAPTPGTNLTVVKNTGLPFITGQFSNLANGATVNLTHNGTTYPFVAWYYGGEGNNDLVLLWPYTGLAAWGDNFNGQLGDDSMTNRPASVNVDQSGALLGKTIVQVARGDSHTLALCSDGTVAAWGSNSIGQLGNNSTVGSSVPVAVNRVVGTSSLAGKTVVVVAAGTDYSLALCSDGTVSAWGWNTHGQLGDNTVIYGRLVPVAVSVTPEVSALADKKVVAIAAGNLHSLALCSDGTVAAWGENSGGQLGNNSQSDSVAPVAVSVTSGISALYGKTVIAIAVGDAHSLALCSDGTVAAWGINNYGQRGDDFPLNAYTPVAVNMVAGTSALAGKSVVAIAAGSYHSLALCGDGSVAAWGSNYNGKLGDGSVTDRQVPTAVNATAGTSALAGRTVTTVAAGNHHSLALCSDGTVAAWGGNSAGQLGDNSKTSRSVPVAVNMTAGTTTLASRLVSGLSSSSMAEHSTVIFGKGATPSVIPSIQQTQSITFAPPTTLYLGQSPFFLRAYSNSGLTVKLTVVPSGTTSAGASIVNNSLSFTGVGTVQIQAQQAGGDSYLPAPTVVKTITVKATPQVLTLIKLAQIYTSAPREISTLGGTGTVKVEYKIGTTFGTTAPTNAGSYSVRATDDLGTKTGTLVIAKSPLYVRPVDQRKFMGEDNPPLTLNYSSSVSLDPARLVTTAPLLKTTATKTSVGGAYPITASGGVVSPNYVFIYQQGVLMVDSHAGSYETMLTNGEEVVGKLAVTVSAANSTFTGKLYSKDEKTALSLKGALVTNHSIGMTSGHATVSSNGISYTINITTLINGALYANVTRDSTPYARTSLGRRLLMLAAGKTVTYSGAHTAVLEPATPAASDVPAGAGWATAAISAKGVMTYAGRLGDGTSFTTSLSPDDASDPTYRLFVQPYKTGAATRLQSYLGGAFTLLQHPTLTGRRYVEAAALSWAKAGLTSDTSYSAGFGPLSTVMMLDPWLPPATGFSLATRLGLTNSSFQVLHSVTGSTLNGNLPTRAALSATNLVSVTTPSANATKWKATLVPATGMFSGSFELADTTPKPRAVNFSGVLRQPATQLDIMIGDGHYLLPPLTGTGTSTGEVMYQRP